MVTLYSNHCPKCKILTQKLNQADIQYVEVNDIDLMIEKGFMTMPILEVDGVGMSFVESVNWINERNN